MRPRRATLALALGAMLNPWAVSAQDAAQDPDQDPAPDPVASGEPITVTGEIIDTWCYFSGVMGPPESTLGTAHHTCALWCSAGGIPVGLLAEDGTVYMVLKIEDDPESAGGDAQLRLASHEVTAEGTLYERDGLNYIVVSEVVADEGITTINHEEWGPVPSFAIPEPE